MTRDFRSMLRAQKLRVTEPRLAVLRQVAKGGHLTAEQLRLAVEDNLGSVSTQTIYDIVHALSDVNILRKVEPAGQVAHYELNEADNHHHLICRNCGHIEDTPCQLDTIPCAQPTDPKGYIVQECHVTYWGLCSKCQ